MNKNTVIGIVALLAAGGGYYYYQTVQKAAAPSQTAGGRPAGGQGTRPPVSILASNAVTKQLPVRIDAVGSVQPIAQVNIRPRVDSQVVKVHVADGASVKEGDPIVTLDSRQLSALLAQAEGQTAKEKASLEGARREIVRQTELFKSDSSSRKVLDDATTKLNELSATIKAGEANIDNLKVQLSYTEIKSPLTGRIGTLPLKQGAIVRQGEVGMTLGTVIQTAPIYVAFGVPQRRFAEVKAAFDKNLTALEVTQIGTDKVVKGKLTVLDNTVDIATGNVILRGTFENKDEALWAGSLVNVRLLLGADNAVTVPSTAIQIGQQGTYVYVVKDNVARVRPVASGRTLDNETVIDKGLENGETVVTDGQLALINGSPVIIRQAGGGAPQAGGQRPASAPPAPQGSAPPAPQGSAPNAPQGAQGQPTQSPPARTGG